jgi:thiamine pyrophosphate-dependent acetolactate synthase large subunit-like protein/nitrite reductase/ring-hydroxylating ferredoxin subunit
MSPSKPTEGDRAWHRIEGAVPAPGEVTAHIVGGRAVCLARVGERLGALDNRCPHQGGPLGEGTIEEGWVICPWHGFEYDPVTGEPPEGYGDRATPYDLEERTDGMYVELPVVHERRTLMDQMVDTMLEWGIDAVFGMVGHSNLGLAEALRHAEERDDLTYIGIRHEGAAAFAASAFGKLTGRPAACFSIAGPGATNLLTGLWDAKVDRAPILALTGQVQNQVLGPGAFQEIPLAAAFEAVAQWSQTVLGESDASELMALAIKHAVVERDVAHLIFPDDVQNLPGVEDPPAHPREGRVASHVITPPPQELDRAIALLTAAERPVVILGNGARPFREQIIQLAEQIDAPLLTTFKAKGSVPYDHRLACGALGRSGTPVAAATMGHSDCLLVLGASFSNHTGISQKKPTIQVDFDRMTLGKFHPVDVPLWGDIGATVALLRAALPGAERPDVRAAMERRRRRWDLEKQRRMGLMDERGAMHPARVFAVLSNAIPADAVITVDVGNNTYAFGHYFETTGSQDILMSGYLGSIGFALPAALGAAVAVGPERKVVSISGDGGLGQYLAEFTTAVKYRMPITHIVLNNDELAKISREQVSALRPVWQTDLVNPDFAAYAELCGGRGFRVETPDELEDAVEAALAVEDGPSMLEIRVSPRWV